MQKKNIVVSLDVEATGTSPATSSCVMIGCVAVYDNIDPNPLNLNDWVISKKAWCIKEQPNKPPETRCWDEFWTQNKDLWKHIQENAMTPQQAMQEFHDWYSDLNSKFNIKIVCKPSSYDFQWLNCMYDEYGPANKIRLPFSVVCLSTIFKVLDMLHVKRDVINSYVRHDSLPHNHYADDDALEQAFAYLKAVHWIKTNIKIDKKFK